MDDLTLEEYEMLDKMLDEEEGFESKLANANLTFTQAQKQMQNFVVLAKQLAASYSLPLSNKARFCELLFERTASIPRQDLLCLYTAVLCDKGLLFAWDRESRTVEQDICCYLDMQQNMTYLTDEIECETQYNRAFKQLLHELRHISTNGLVTAPQEDIDFVVKTIFECLPAKVRRFESEIFSDNIAWVCSQITTHKGLLRIAPLFIFQIIRLHLSRLGGTPDFQCQIDKLWSFQEYKIDEDNGKNFKQHIGMLTLFLDLCNYYQQNSAVDINLCLYGFAALSNLSEWYYLNCEYNEEVPLPVPLSIRIAQSHIDCFEVTPEYGCSSKEFDAFLNNESMCSRFEKKIHKYLMSHPEILQQYITNLPEIHDQNRYLVYQILDEAPLPTTYITPGNLSLIYTVINFFLEMEINQRNDSILLQIGTTLTHPPFV